MRRRVLRRISSLLGWALGFSACGESLVYPEYGMPHADFDLDGKVVRAGTATRIPGIEVQFGHGTAITDAEGEWTLSVDGTVACGSDCHLMATDVDGEANGSYRDTMVQFSATRVSDGGGDSYWYEGEWEAHDIDIEMEPTEGNSGE